MRACINNNSTTATSMAGAMRSCIDDEMHQAAPVSVDAVTRMCQHLGSTTAQQHVGSTMQAMQGQTS
jgi:uncharacterized protein YneF (UPF0154 family)